MMLTHELMIIWHLKELAKLALPKDVTSAYKEVASLYKEEEEEEERSRKTAKNLPVLAPRTRCIGATFISLI